MNTEKITRYFALAGKVVWVAGGSRGRGLERCRADGEAVATVVVS